MNIRKKKKKEEDKSFRAYPHLLAIKPKEKYIFHSDYYQVDDRYACILSFFHAEGASDNFGPFWGINRIPSGMPEGVMVYSFEQVRRMSDKWIESHQSQAENVANMNQREQGTAGTNTTLGKATRKSRDLEQVARELQDGASYLHVNYRLMLTAPSLEVLEDAIKKLDRLYIDRFATVEAAPYFGEQRHELSTLFAKNEKKVGKGFYFTSTEFAGSYSLVTHGLEDPDGEYVGYMIGDVNNSAVLFNVNRYQHHIVVGNENYEESLGRVFIGDMWGSKVSQACLLNNHKVVHLILNGADLDRLGPKFDALSYRIDMNHGDVNMFEMFGDVKDELSIFPSQMHKLVLMAEQAYETTDSDRSIIRGSLEEIATNFYIDQKMWYANAADNRSKLRVTGIPHEQVPKLEVFCSYLDMEYKAMVNQSARDEKRLNALSVLKVTFNNLLSNNGDLFNTITTPVIDGAKDGRRVIYDFSDLSRRGHGVAMAQLVNVISFAIGNLGYGDTVVIHGTEMIDDGVKDYINLQFDQLYHKGGRVCFIYDKMDKMLEDKAFSQFDKADYTIFGNMSDTIVNQYQKELGQDIPTDLERLITNKSDSACYIRRGFDNVVFRQDLSLGLDRRVMKR